MAPTLLSILKSTDEKIETLGSLNQELRNEILRLKEEISNLRNELGKKERLLQQANLDIEYLKISYRLASSPDSIVSARRRIARLIRTIDRCISMIEGED